MLNYAALRPKSVKAAHDELFRFKGGSLTVKKFVIDEPKMVRLFESMREEGMDDSRLADKLATLLYLGYMADQSIRITDKVDYVKEGFESMTRNIDSKIENDFASAVREKIDEFLGGEGTFTREMQDTFGEDGKHSQQIRELVEEYRERLEAVLDPHNETSPFKVLEKNMEEKYSVILQFMNQQEGRASAEEKSPQKGRRFEDFMSSVLGESAQILGCNVENVSSKPGILGSSHAKKGDFVLTEKKTSKKIVLEAKNLAKDPSTKQILDYSRRALENREADYCVYVYCDSDDSTVPEAGMFNEVDKNILFVTVSDSDTHEAKKRLVLFACSWALARVKSAEGGRDLDEKLGKLETQLRRNLDTIKTIKNNSQSITTACKNMMNDLEVDLGLKQEKPD